MRFGYARFLPVHWQAPRENSVRNFLRGMLLACACLLPCAALADDAKPPDEAELVDNALLLSEMYILNTTRDLEKSLAGLPRAAKVAECIQKNLPPKTREAFRGLIREAATPEQLARGAALANSETSAKLRFYVLSNRETLTAEAKKLGVPLDEYSLEKGAANEKFTAEESIVLQEFINWYHDLAPSLREKFKALDAKLSQARQGMVVECVSSN